VPASAMAEHVTCKVSKLPERQPIPDALNLRFLASGQSASSSCQTAEATILIHFMQMKKCPKSHQSSASFLGCLTNHVSISSFAQLVHRYIRSLHVP